jgi:transposase InsO family protein
MFRRNGSHYYQAPLESVSRLVMHVSLVHTASGRDLPGFLIGGAAGTGVAISMDGFGRCQDNTFVERLWGTLKHHYRYLHPFAGGAERRQGLSDWIRFYNHERGHSALDDRAPDDVYCGYLHPFVEAA